MFKLNKIFLFFNIAIILAIVAITAVYAWNPPATNPPNPAGQTLYSNPSNDIGIGTLYPSAKTEIRSISSDSVLRLSKGVFSLNPSSTSTLFKIGNDGAFVINNQATDILTIKGGNVGIGTTGPSGKLEVHQGGVGAGFSTPLVRLKDTTISNQAWDIYGSDGGASPLKSFRISDTDTSTGTENWRFVIDNSGNVGIGTTAPAAPAWGTSTRILHVAGSPGAVINLQSTDAGGRQYQMGSWTDGTFYMAYDSIAGEHRLVVNSTGNVGIGTTAPNVKLHVIGQIRASEGVIAREGPPGCGPGGALFTQSTCQTVLCSIEAGIFYHNCDGSCPTRVGEGPFTCATSAIGRLLGM